MSDDGVGGSPLACSGEMKCSWNGPIVDPGASGVTCLVPSPDVDELGDARLGDKDVPRGEVAVNDTALVGKIETGGNLFEQPGDIIRAKRALVFDHILERFALKVFRDNERRTCIFAEVQDLDDVRMVEPGAEGGVAAKLFSRCSIGNECGRNALTATGDRRAGRGLGRRRPWGLHQFAGRCGSGG